MKPLLASVTTAVLIVGAVSAQSQSPTPEDGTYYTNPPSSDVGQAAPTAYEGPAPGDPSVAPVYVPRLSGYGRQAWPGETSPGADLSVRLRSFVDPTTSVTAAPNPNNMSDQVPSRGPALDGVPPGTPY